MKRTIQIHAAVGETGEVNAAYYEHDDGSGKFRDVTDVGLLSDGFYDYKTKMDKPHRYVTIEVEIDVDALFKDFRLQGTVVDVQDPEDYE